MAQIQERSKISALSQFSIAKIHSDATDQLENSYYRIAGNIGGH